MENSATSWFSELGMEDPFLSDQCDIMDFFDEELSAALVDEFQSSLSPEGNSSSFSTMIIPRSSSTTTTTLCASSAMEAAPVATLSSAMEVPPVSERPAKHAKRSYRSSPIILTFGNPSMQEMDDQTLGNFNPDDDAVSEVWTSNGSFANLEEATKSVQTKTKKTGGRVRPASQTYDHIIAERKRREQLSQRFVALQAIVPGLKKMDKTSVLGDAITYLKHLQERVKTLEEQATKQPMDSLVIVKKSQVLVEDEGSSEEIGSTDEQPLPEIEAKLCDKKVLLRVHCENHQGVLVKLLSEVEKFNLAVTNTNVAPFGSLAVDITIMAEMEKEFKLTIKDLVKSLGSALQRVAQDA